MTAPSNIPLKVSFKEKDEAKSLGARWNPEAKHWYVPEGVDATPFKKWFDGETPQITAKTSAHKEAKTTSTSHTNTATNKPSTDDAGIDDINAMLRDAYEVFDSQ